MKKLLKKGLIALSLVLALSSLPLISEARYCAWHNGHQVCWNQRYVNRCYWTGGYWHHGWYHRGHRVCRW